VSRQITLVLHNLLRLPYDKHRIAVTPLEQNRDIAHGTEHIYPGKAVFSCVLHLGGAISLTPTPHAIEFSWVTFPALARSPNKVGLAAVIVLIVPAGLYSTNPPITE
jgi:hypothetical protein